MSAICAPALLWLSDDMSSSRGLSSAPACGHCKMVVSAHIPADISIAPQELEAEEERLWKEQVEAAQSRAGPAGEKYRRDREVRHSMLEECLD